MGFDLYGNAECNKKGEYFRNNVWWWRRLADYVCEFSGVINEEDKKLWQTNDGHQVSKEEAEQIANQLEHLLKSGHTEKFLKQVEREMKVAEATNKKVNELMEQITKKAEAILGEGVAPMKYPKELKEEWDSTYELHDQRASYHFEIKNVKEFITFCRNSEGFRIS